MKKRSKRESPRKTSREAPGRRESTNSRRSTKTRRKASNSRDTSNRGSTGYNRGKPRGKEVSVAEELPRDKPEDMDQEVEVTLDTCEHKEIEERRQPLHVESLLDTFKRFLERLHKELREHTEDLRKDPENRKYQALIAQDHLAIQAIEESIRRP